RDDGDDEGARRVRADLLDLAICWADLRVRRARGDDLAAARAEAERVLTEAERLFGPNAVLLWERRALTGVPGPGEAAPAARAPLTAWDHYAAGRRLLRAGELES